MVKGDYACVGLGIKQRTRRTIGMVGTQVVMVVHAWPDFDTETGEEVGRVISARKATRREREAYEEGHY